MKILGHIYVTLKSVPNRNKPLLTWGSILPEMMFYVEANPFSFEEIHEGGEKLLNFLRKEKPAWEDLALGLMTHSQGGGADRFDKFDKLVLLGYERGKDIKFEKIVEEATNIRDTKIVRIRVHNILDLALDDYISGKYPWVLIELKKALTQIPIPEMAQPLANCFKKDRVMVEKAICQLKNKINPDDLTSVEGLARMFTSFSASLTEKIAADAPKTQKAIRKAVKMIKGKEELFLNEVITYTRKNITPLL